MKNMKIELTEQEFAAIMNDLKDKANKLYSDHKQGKHSVYADYKLYDGLVVKFACAKRTSAEAIVNEEYPDPHHDMEESHSLTNFLENKNEEGYPREESPDPFRQADNWTNCPNCGAKHGWNNEDGLTEQTCVCGYEFTGVES